MLQDFLKVGKKVLWVTGAGLKIARVLRINSYSVDIEYKGDTGFIYTTSVNAENLRVTKEA
jgi:hypothetical protein